MFFDDDLQSFQNLLAVIFVEEAEIQVQTLEYTTKVKKKKDTFKN